MNEQKRQDAIKKLQDAKAEGMNLQGMATFTSLVVAVAAVAWWTFLMYLAIQFGGILVPVLMSLYVISRAFRKIADFGDTFKLIDEADNASK